MRPAVSVTPDTPASAALKILSENRIARVPVIDVGTWWVASPTVTSSPRRFPST